MPNHFHYSLSVLFMSQGQLPNKHGTLLEENKKQKRPGGVKTKAGRLHKEKQSMELQVRAHKQL